MNSGDLWKLVAAAVAVYGAYQAWQAFQRNESIRNGVALVVAGVGAYTAIDKLA